MSTRLSLTLLKYVEGEWKDVRHGIREDFERIEMAVNRGIAGLNSDITKAASAETSINDILPVTLLLAGAGNTAKKTTAASDEALASAMLLMGAGPRQKPPDDPFVPALFLGGM